MSQLDKSVLSWGRFFRYAHHVKHLNWPSDDLSFLVKEHGPFLPYGLGRSYGDSCLNDQGTLICTSRLNRFIEFSPIEGKIRCESGTTLAEILELVVPNGWFLPSTPGTKFITVGGAVANDVHGKNHHRSGTFGCHVDRFELVRSNGERLICSPDENKDLFRATIGGMGLTGLITWVEFRLRKITTPLINAEDIKFENIDEFMTISQESDEHFEYTVAWVDCMATGRNLGRGIFMRGNHAELNEVRSVQSWDRHWRQRAIPMLNIPFDFPNFSLNRLSINAFNLAYYGKQRQKVRKHFTPFDPFFYPLDIVGRWNHIYGERGFFQYQCVIPNKNASAIKTLFEEITKSGQASFLAVLKQFGAVMSPGLVSFPEPGLTLALDFPNRGQSTLELFQRLDEIVFSNEGRLYPAKDSAGPADAFKKAYPRWTELRSRKDPKFSSSFWRRMKCDE